MAETEPTTEVAATAAPAAGAEAAAAAVPPAGQEALAVIEVDEEEEVEETQEPQAREDGELIDDEEEEEDEESETSMDLTTHYHQVADSQSALDDQWLLILWSYQNEEIQARYQMDVLGYWTKVNDKAKEVNAELEKRGKQTLLPAKMFLHVWEHLNGMGMGVLTETELDTGYADDDLKTRLNQSY